MAAAAACALASTTVVASQVARSHSRSAATPVATAASFVNSQQLLLSRKPGLSSRTGGVPGHSPRVSFVTVCKVLKGDIVPPVVLKDQDGKLVNLDKFRGRPLVLYFYPADETPGCTEQACAFRDSYEKFKRAGAEVVGVSGDTPESHRVFKARHRLPFTLLSDEGNKMRKDWGVPSDLFGALAGRQTYVIDKDGRVQLIFNNQFEPEKHIVETLNVLQG
ncbi:hypothetical protein M758_10G176500 [Ceratodon purpureus]|nr:hypothetical protein M758_10G176500 [Ceratodon purpureus]